MVGQIDEKIKGLKDQPGSEAQIAALNQDKIKLMQRASEVPATDITSAEAKVAAGATISPIQRGLIRMYNSREYKNSFPDQQRDMRVRAYDQYVAPFYKRQGQTPPDRDYFVDHVAPDTDQPLGEVFKAAGVTALKETDLMLRTIWSGMSAVGAFSMYGTDPREGYKLGKESSVGKYLTDMIDLSDKYIGDKYADDMRARAIKWGGSQIPSMIFWELGGSVTKLGAGVANVYGRFALNRVGDFALGFLGDKLQEKDNKEAAETGGIFAGLGAAQEFLGKMISWLGPKAAAQQITKDAQKLLEARGKGPIITPPPSEIIPPQGELPGLPKRPLLPGVGETNIRTPGGGIAQPPSTVPGLGTKLLRSGVEGAKRPLDFISQANFRILNQAVREVSADKFRTFVMAPDSVRIEALKKIGYAFGEAAKNAAEHNPELIQNSAKASIKQQAAKSPAFKKIIDVTAQMTGQKPEVTIANHVMEMSKKEKVWSQISELAKGLGPGAASKNEKAVLDAVRDQVRAKIGLQGPINQTIFAWAVRDRLPAEVQKIVGQEMYNRFGANPKRWDRVGRMLLEHIEKLVQTGHIPPDDLRGVFRSTALEGPKTVWQDQLDKEVKDIINNAGKTAKKFGPGAASIDDPAFKPDPNDPQAMNKRIAGYVSKTDEERERLKAAFAASGDKGTGRVDTGIMDQVAQKLFNKPLNQLTTQEISQVAMEAAKISKGGK